MSIEPGTLASIAYREAGTADTKVTITKGLFSFPDVSQDPETIDIATGIALRLRDRDNFTIRIWDWSEFNAIKDKMLARENLEWDLNGESTITLDPVRFTVRPLFDQVPDQSEIFIGAFDASDDPTTTPGDWASLGGVLAGNPLNSAVEGDSDGIGLNFYTTSRIEGTFRLYDDAAATALASYNRADCRLAIKNPDGLYVILGTSANPAFSQWSRAPRYGVTEIASAIELNVSCIGADIDTFLTLTGTPPDYVRGFEVVCGAVSTNQADYMTIT